MSKMNSAAYERILMKFKDSKDHKEMMVKFGVFLSGQPAEIISKAYDDFLNGLRDEYLKEHDGKRSSFQLKHLWDAETVSVEFVRAEMKKRQDEEKAAEDLKKKTLLAKNVKPCPHCESKDTYLYERRENNGIVGPGFSSWVVDSYWVCNDCETLFGKPGKNSVI